MTHSHDRSGLLRPCRLRCTRGTCPEPEPIIRKVGRRLRRARLCCQGPSRKPSRTPRPFEQEVPGLRAWTFEAHEAQRIPQPVLAVLGGESDKLWPRFGETQRRLLSSLPNVEGVVLAGVSHAMSIQDPAAVAAALAAFYRRHPISRSVALMLARLRSVALASAVKKKRERKHDRSDNVWGGRTALSRLRIHVRYLSTDFGCAAGRESR